MSVAFVDSTLLIDTKMDTAELREFLRSCEPWRHKINFTSGISTTDFKTTVPMNNTPLSKILHVERNMGELKGFTRALDVGSNAGYNSIYLAERYGTETVGIDFSERHIQVSTLLARLAGIGKCSFKRGDAETYLEPEGFDLVIHFGTLYHLKNPVLAIETALKNLRPGGLLLLETQTYGPPEETRAEFIHMLGGDHTNWWALGEASIVRICDTLGADVAVVGKRVPSKLAEGQSRVIFKITKRPEA